MSNITKTRPLVPGDIYQEGDKGRHIGYSKIPRGFQNRSTDELTTGPWFHVAPGMFGQSVLPADLITVEFQRRVK